MFTIFWSIIIFWVLCIFCMFFQGYIEYKKIIEENLINDRINKLEEKVYYINLSHISKCFREAVIAIEDHRFYYHKGVDIISIFRAIFYNIRYVKILQGGSTITQQLCKNLLKYDAKTLKRKICEIFLSKYVEKNYSKDKILELYLNIIYFGYGYYGIKEASYGYFKISPASLNFEQSTLLAGIIQAPSYFDIKNISKKEVKRQNQVIYAINRWS